MNLSDKYADIASYQLYAYQEVAGMNPNTTLWKKVGDVRALPLPMACTLTQVNGVAGLKSSLTIFRRRNGEKLRV